LTGAGSFDRLQHPALLLRCCGLGTAPGPEFNSLCTARRGCPRDHATLPYPTPSCLARPDRHPPAMGPGRLTLTNPVPIPRSPGLRAAALALALPDAGDGGRHGGRAPGPARSCAAPCICLPGMVAPVVAWPAGGFNSTPRGQGDGDLSSERVARRKTAGDVRAFCVAGLRHVCVRSIGWGDHGSCTCLTVVCSRAPSKVKKNEHPACILPLLFFSACVHKGSTFSR